MRNNEYFVDTSHKKFVIMYDFLNDRYSLDGDCVTQRIPLFIISASHDQ